MKNLMRIVKRNVQIRDYGISVCGNTESFIETIRNNLKKVV